ncbi:BRO-like protein [Vibrio cholerae]|uniref:BRO-N domain-containing protein n=1 Tax=Vibrio cholerae TaxID=666 RepID=UPI000E0A772C|nr:BRO-like protein [Vibrio cholerae]EHB5529251.1 BRO-like protein [Vibrio cholerae]EJL6503442.1 BRO-like protein [Vibrio cholerae]EJL6666378.1 BRO-like protein [Vibrio cholerae]EJY4342188.1 BRO-like protein [Vibrio cholerae]ELG5195387.1 BRO-like protein [Vibrio cholerae]
MESELISVCYEGESGSCDIRTCNFDGILHLSLTDIFVTLTRENRQLNERYPSKYIPNLVTAQLKELDDDEYINVPVSNPRFENETEVFVTQPGLNRVMGSDKSKAGKRFQRWLYHEVIPSLQKHGVYPAPKTPQGSALAQMAEIVAQNSRLLADTIQEQEKLKLEVSTVKDEVSSVQARVSKLENFDHDSKFIITVRQWFKEANQFLSSEKEFDIVTWCENLSLRHSKRSIPCPSGERLNARFHKPIIEEAKSLVERARG